MKVFKYFMLIFILLFSFNYKVYAKSCDNTDIKRLKVIADNVDIDYEFNYDSKDRLVSLYNVTISNITDEIYIVESKSNTSYKDNIVNDGILSLNNISSGKKTYKVYSKNCNVALRTIYVKLVPYNHYSEDSLCENMDEIDVCSEFYDTTDLNYYEFEEIINKYLNNDSDNDKDDDIDNDIDNVSNNIYIYISIPFVLLGIFLMFIFIKKNRKKRVLK